MITIITHTTWQGKKPQAHAGQQQHFCVPGLISTDGQQHQKPSSSCLQVGVAKIKQPQQGHCEDTAL
jgi:hypothetical protein